jgi:hypothetical protein
MRGGAMTMASAKMADKERQAEVRGGRPCAVDGQRVQAVYRQRTTDRRRLYAEADAWDMFMFMFSPCPRWLTRRAQVNVARILSALASRSCRESREPGAGSPANAAARAATRAPAARPAKGPVRTG